MQHRNSTKYKLGLVHPVVTRGTSPSRSIQDRCVDGSHWARYIEFSNWLPINNMEKPQQSSLTANCFPWMYKIVPFITETYE